MGGVTAGVASAAAATAAGLGAAARNKQGAGMPNAPGHDVDSGEPVPSSI